MDLQELRQEQLKYRSVVQALNDAELSAMLNAIFACKNKGHLYILYSRHCSQIEQTLKTFPVSNSAQELLEFLVSQAIKTALFFRDVPSLECFYHFYFFIKRQTEDKSEILIGILQRYLLWNLYSFEYAFSKEINIFLNKRRAGFPIETQKEIEIKFNQFLAEHHEELNLPADLEWNSVGFQKPPDRAEKPWVIFYELHFYHIDPSEPYVKLRNISAEIKEISENDFIQYAKWKEWVFRITHIANVLMVRKGFHDNIFSLLENYIMPIESNENNIFPTRLALATLGLIEKIQENELTLGEKECLLKVIREMMSKRILDKQSNAVERFSFERVLITIANRNSWKLESWAILYDKNEYWETLQNLRVDLRSEILDAQRTVEKSEAEDLSVEHALSIHSASQKNEEFLSSESDLGKLPNISLLSRLTSLFRRVSSPLPLVPEVLASTVVSTVEPSHSESELGEKLDDDSINEDYSVMLSNGNKEIELLTLVESAELPVQEKAPNPPWFKRIFSKGKPS